MPPELDSAIVKALALDISSTKITSHGGGGFASTSKITSTIDGKENHFFVKTGRGPDSAIMFTGTYLSPGSLDVLDCVSPTATKAP